MIMENNKHITLEGYTLVLSYKAALKKGLYAAIFKNKIFSDIIPFDTSNIIINNNIISKLHCRIRSCRRFIFYI